MRMRVDKEADALYIRFDDANIVELLDDESYTFDEQGRAVVARRG